MNYLIQNVNSPVRSLARDADGELLQVSRGEGAHLFTEDGRKFLDFIMGYGCLPFGHAFPPLLDFLKKEMARGSSFGLTSTVEIQLAKNITQALDLDEHYKTRFTNSGSEAAMLAVRIAQKFTGKKKIIKFQECYHGWGEVFTDTATILPAKFNNLESVKNQIKQHKGEIAVLILEPVCANQGLILPQENFLKELESICREEKILLILDEVISAFRIHFGGAFRFFDIQPDLIVLGKVLSQGYPFGAVVGREEILGELTPEGELFHAGTFNGNLLSCSAANFTLDYLKENYSKLADLGKTFDQNENIENIGTLFSIKNKTPEEYRELYLKLLKENILISPSHEEVGFISLAHAKEDIELLSSVLC